ncbi:MAG: GtrA family protein [bacterium]|nr:GtrA family protein [bacterium]
MNGLLRRGPRYIAISLFCMALSNTILIGMDRAGFSYSAGVLISAAILIPVGFLLQARVTFAVPLRWDAFFRYAGALSLNVPLSWLALFLIHDLGGLDMLWAAPISTILLFLWTYLTSSWALAARRPLARTI